MFATALLMCVLAYWNIKLSHIPILGLDVEAGAAGPTKGVVLSALVVFFVYTVAAFTIRARVETNRMADPDARVKDAIASIETVREELRAVDLGEMVPKLRELAAELKTNAQFIDPVGFEKRLIQIQETAGAVQQAAEVQLPVSGTNRETEPLRRYAANVKRDELRDAAVALVASTRQMQTDSAKFARTVTAAGEQLTAAIVRLEEARQMQTTATPGALVAATEEFARLSAVLRGVGTLDMIERNVISFWLPLIASVGLVIAAVSQAWEGMLPWHWLP
jgi:hypothetical protein